MDHTIWSHPSILKYSRPQSTSINRYFNKGLEVPCWLAVVPCNFILISIFQLLNEFPLTYKGLWQNETWHENTSLSSSCNIFHRTGTEMASHLNACSYAAEDLELHRNSFHTCNSKGFTIPYKIDLGDPDFKSTGTLFFNGNWSHWEDNTDCIISMISFQTMEKLKGTAAYLKVENITWGLLKHFCLLQVSIFFLLFLWGIMEGKPTGRHQKFVLYGPHKFLW